MAIEEGMRFVRSAGCGHRAAGEWRAPAGCGPPSGITMAGARTVAAVICRRSLRRRRDPHPGVSHLGSISGRQKGVFVASRLSCRQKFRTVFTVSDFSDDQSIGLYERGDRCRTLAEVRIHVARLAIDHCGGNFADAARQLGIGRTTLYRIIRSSLEPREKSRSARADRSPASASAS